MGKFLSAFICVHLRPKLCSCAFVAGMLGAPLWAQPTVAITSPSDGTVVHPGSSVTVTVAVSPIDGFRMVMIVPEDSLKAKGVLMLKAPPYQFTVDVPRDTYVAGKYTLTAAGVLPDQIPYSDPISVDVERADRPLRLQTQLSRLYFDYVGDAASLIVYGYFADRSRADLTYSSLTTYISGSQAIVKVDSNGLATAIGAGSSSITVENNGAKRVVPVSVPRGAPPAVVRKNP